MTAAPAFLTLRARRLLTLSLLVTGYAGYYLCRSDLSVALPLLIQQMSDAGVSPGIAKVQLGWVASLGVLGYALGKFPSGSLADFLGGRRNFLGGMGGAILFTVLFACGGGLPIFTLAWVGNRLVQSLGWAGMVKITSKWFSYSSYGAVMGVVSLSYLFGDAAAREFLALLISQGVGWRGLFLAAAGTLAVLFVLNLLLLREGPESLDLPPSQVNPGNLFHEEGALDRPANLGALLRTFARSRAFWLVCALSLGVTLLRETFNLWTPTYFTQTVGVSASRAAAWSALFPFFGGISVLCAGFLSDRLGGAGRAKIIFMGLLLTSVTLVVLALADPAASQFLPVALVALVAFLMMGPYSYLAGAISLDFGGKQASATASGWIDGIGYLGGVLAGNQMASISVAWGWKGAFVTLAAVAALSTAAAGLYLHTQPSRRTGETRA